MQYQVVARRCLPTAGRWDYYPYLAPGRDKAAAERLARYAAQNGYEAAVLQSVTMEMVVNMARAAVERQDEHVLPALRYKPGTKVGTAGQRSQHEVELRLSAPVALDLDGGELDTVELDARRSVIELGPGGDVEMGGRRRGQALSFPLRMDVVRAWLRIRERVVVGQVGGPTDGTGDEVDVEDAS